MSGPKSNASMSAVSFVVQFNYGNIWVSAKLEWVPIHQRMGGEGVDYGKVFREKSFKILC